MRRLLLPILGWLATTGTALAADPDIVLMVSGSYGATNTQRWSMLGNQWLHQLREVAGAERVIPLREGETPPRNPGVLVAVHVASFSYVAPWQRAAKGIAMQRAFLSGSVQLRDLRTGDLLGERTYNEESQYAEGRFQDSTNRQVRNVVESIVADLRRIQTSAPAAAARQEAPAAPGEVPRAERVFWETVRNSRDPAELLAYVQQYPNGAFVVLARQRLGELGYKEPATPR